MSPHLLIEGSPQDIAPNRRNHTPLAGFPVAFQPPALVFVACLERLLNELQHSAVSDLFSDRSQEFVAIDRPKIIFQIRVCNPLASSLYTEGNRISLAATGSHLHES